MNKRETLSSSLIFSSLLLGADEMSSVGSDSSQHTCPPAGFCISSNCELKATFLMSHCQPSSHRNGTFTMMLGYVLYQIKRQSSSSNKVTVSYRFCHFMGQKKNMEQFFLVLPITYQYIYFNLHFKCYPFSPFPPPPGIAPCPGSYTHMTLPTICRV